MSGGQIVKERPRDADSAPQVATTDFHIATNDPLELASLCQTWLSGDAPTPIRADYLHRDLLEMILTHGRDHYLAQRLFGTPAVQLPRVPSRLAGLALQGAARLWPQSLPPRMHRFHAWFAHHLILQVATDHAQPLHRWLEAHLPSRTGAFFACRAEEATIALDYARAAHGMGAHYCQSHSALVCDVVALTLTLPPAPADWQGLLPGPALPKSLADKLSHRLCHGDLRHARLDQQCLVRRGYDPCQIAHDLQVWCMASGAQG